MTLVVGALGAIPATSTPPPNYTKISPALLGAGNDPIPFFITFNNFTARDSLLPQLSLPILNEYSSIPVALVSGTPTDIAYLSTLEAIRALTEDRQYHVDSVDINTTVSGLGVPTGGIGEGYLHGLGYYGSGLVIAVVDTGIDATHADLDDLDDNVITTDPKVIAFSNEIAFPHPGYGDPAGDPNGHGTHVSGIISGTGSASAGAYVGVAPQSQLVAVKVLDGNGDGYESDVISGIDYALSRGDVDIISISLGGASNNPNDPISQSVNAAWDSGVVVVVAAGNNGISGYGSILSPGMAIKPITVGATDGSGVMWWSSKGYTPDVRVKPDVVTPGASIISTIPSGSQIAQDDPWAVIPGVGGDYIAMGGTSMATPHVTGGVALLLEAFPATANDLIKLVLMEGAISLGGPLDENIEGQGAVDLQNAYTLLNGGTYTPVLVTPTAYPQTPHSTTYASLPPAGSSYVLTIIPAGSYTDAYITVTGALAGYLSFSDTTFPVLADQIPVTAYVNLPAILPYGVLTATIEIYDEIPILPDLLLGTAAVTVTILPSADMVAPTVTTIQRTPITVTYADSPAVTARVTDVTTGIGSVLLQYKIGSGSWNDVPATIYPITTYYSGVPSDPTYTLDSTVEAIIPAQAYGAVVTYRLAATDTYGNTFTTAESTYTVMDYTGPAITTIVRTPGSPGLSQPVTVTATVTEPAGAAGIDTVTLQHAIDGGSWIYTAMTFIGGTEYEATIPGQTGGSVTYLVTSLDLAGQGSTSGSYSYTLPLTILGSAVTPATQVRTENVVLSLDENNVATEVYATIDTIDYNLVEVSTGHWEYTYTIPVGATLGGHSVTFTVTAPSGTQFDSQTLTVDDLLISGLLWTTPLGQGVQTFTFTTNYPAKGIVYYRVVGASSWIELTETSFVGSHSLTTPVLLEIATYEFSVRAELAGYYVETGISTFDVVATTFPIVWSVTDNVRGVYATLPVSLVGQLNGYVYAQDTDANGDLAINVVGDVYDVTLDDGVNTIQVQRTVDSAGSVEFAVHFTNAPPIVSGVVVEGYVQSYQSIEISFQVDDYNTLTDLQTVTVILYSRGHASTDPDHPSFHYTATWGWGGGWVITPQNGESPTVEDLATTYDPNAPSASFHIRVTFPNCDDLNDWDILITASDGEAVDTGEAITRSWVNGDAVINVLTSIVDSFVQLFRYVIGFILPIIGVFLGVSRHNKTGSLAVGGVTVITTLIGWVFNPLIAFTMGVASLSLTYGGVGIGTLIKQFLRPTLDRHCATRPTSRICTLTLGSADLTGLIVGRAHPMTLVARPKRRARSKRSIL